MKFPMADTDPIRVFGLPKNLLVEVCRFASDVSGILLVQVPSTIKTLLSNTGRDFERFREVRRRE
jgi:hypothetical protein